MNPKDLNMDKKTLVRIKRLQKQGYPNPIERANFEKIPILKLEKLLYIANKVKDRRLKLKESEIKCNPVTIKNMADAFNFSQKLLEMATLEENLGSGLVGEGILIATYSQIPLEKLAIEILELNKEIKRKKEYKRVICDAGNVDNMVDSALPLDRPDTGPDL